MILVRAGDPVSQSIAEYYAAARDIPEKRILALEISRDSDDGSPPNGRGTDTISLANFESDIATPIESYLAREDPDARIQVLITTLGIPFRIGRCDPGQPQYPRDCLALAVDAALAGLGRLELVTSEDPAEHGRRHWTPNPYFGDPRPFKKFRRQEADAKLRFLVARLTGSPPDDKIRGKAQEEAAGHPEPDIPRAIRNMIEVDVDVDAKDENSDHPKPLWRVFASEPVATRDSASAALLGPLADLLERRGNRICDRCRLPTPPPRLVGAVVQDRPKVKQLERLAFPGLVISLAKRGRDLAEFNRSIDFWTTNGAAAISMHLDDPSLGGVTRPTKFLTAWLDGRTAIEAHFNSVPHLGWTNIFVGDPLLHRARPANRRDDDEEGDSDEDGILDAEDNCLDVPNADQRDSNSDGIGNRCDPDVNNDGLVDTSWGKIYPLDSRGDLERIALTARNGPYSADHDLDGDGQVDERDLALAQLWLFRPPGPSGRRPGRR